MKCHAVIVSFVRKRSFNDASLIAIEVPMRQEP